MESNEKTDQNKIIEYKSEFNIINSSTSLNNPSEFIFAHIPLTDLNESDSAIIHIKNTCKNSYCNCYVNCCFGHSVIYDTFVKTPKSTKYLFQNVASILPDYFTCYFKDNIELLANFKSFIKSTPDEIQTDKGNLFAEMVKNDVFSFCNRKEQILMPVRIPSENRMPGIVKLIYNKEKCLCPFFHAINVILAVLIAQIVLAGLVGLVDLAALAILIVVVLILVDVAVEYVPGLYVVEKIDAVADYVPNLNVIYVLLNLVVAVVDVGSVGVALLNVLGIVVALSLFSNASLIVLKFWILMVN